MLDLKCKNCGVSVIKIGKMCVMSDVAVLYWIRDIAKKAKPLNPKLDNSIVILYEYEVMV